MCIPIRWVSNSVNTTWRTTEHKEPVFQPVVIADDIDASLVPAIEARSREYPGVRILPEHKRHYPKGLVAAHAMGHVGEINRPQLESWEPDR